MTKRVTHLQLEMLPFQKRGHSVDSPANPNVKSPHAGNLEPHVNVLLRVHFVTVWICVVLSMSQGWRDLETCCCFFAPHLFCPLHALERHRIGFLAFLTSQLAPSNNRPTHTRPSEKHMAGHA